MSETNEKHKAVGSDSNEGLGVAISWDDLAQAYDKAHRYGRRARTLPMGAVFDWAERQTSVFRVSCNGTIHRVMK